MPSDRTIRTQLTNTYLSRAIETKDEVQGRFAKEEASTVVGAGAKYPAAGGPWSDPTAAVLNSAPDVTGYDQTSAPVIGGAQPLSGPPRRELAQSDAPDLSALSDSELLHRRRWAELAMKTTFEDTEKIDRCQAIIDAVDQEQRRRRNDRP
jgi:hypothetical protein